MNIFNWSSRYLIMGLFFTVVLIVAVMFSFDVSFDEKQTNSVASSDRDNTFINKSVMEVTNEANDIGQNINAIEKTALSNTTLAEKQPGELSNIATPALPVLITQTEPEIPTAEDEFLLATLDVKFTDYNYITTTDLNEVMSSDEYRQLTRTGRKVFLAELTRKMNHGELDTEQMVGKKLDQAYIDSLEKKARLVTGDYQ